MMINLFSASGLLLSVTCFIVAFITLTSGKSSLHRIWASFNISILIWGIGAFFIGIARNPETALLWLRIAHIGIIFMPIFLFHFICLLCEINHPRIILGLYILGLIFILLDFTNLFLSSTRLNSSH